MTRKIFILSISFFVIFNILLYPNLYGSETQILDSFDRIVGWKVIASDQVDIKIQQAEGFSQNALKIDFHFQAGAGYGGIQKEFPITLPENFQFSFYIKGQGPSNNLEFKFLDASGENVWWVNQRNFEFPADWKKIVIKKRQISFAWGPTEDRSLRHIHKIEFIIASANGGKGTILLDQLVFEKLDPPDSIPPQPIFSASSSASPSHPIQFIHDGDTNTYWRSSDVPEMQEILIDFQKYREFGGLIIHWDKRDYPKKYEVWVSNDKKRLVEGLSGDLGSRGTKISFLEGF